MYNVLTEEYLLAHGRLLEVGVQLTGSGGSVRNENIGLRPFDIKGLHVL